MRSAHPQVRRTSRVAALCLLALLLGAAQVATAEEAGVWTPLGPRAATVFALERDPQNPSLVYAGTYFGGLYASQNGGLSWTPVPSPFATSTVFGIAVDPAVAGTLYVATYDLGIFKSTDGGTTWTSLPIPNSTPVQAIAIDPRNRLKLLAATYTELLSSSDGGQTWAPTVGAGTGAIALLFDPRAPGLAYLGTSGEGAFVSRDSGMSWTRVSGGPASQVFLELEIDPTTPGAALASTTDGVFRLKPDATGFDDLSFDLPVKTVAHTLRHPTTSTIFAATDAGVFRLDADSPTHWARWTNVGARHLLIEPAGRTIHVASTTGSLSITGDDGRSFQPADYGIQNRFVESLVTVDVFGQTVIYAGTDHDVEFSSEAFRNAVELPWLGGTDLRGGVFSVAPHPLVKGTLFSGTEGAGVWKTTDYGTTWNPSSKGIVPAGVLALDQSPVAEHTLYAGTSYGIFASRDNGLTWNPNIDTTPRPVSAVLADPVRNRVAYYGTGAGEVFRTFDDGQSFYRAWEGSGPGIRKLAAARWGNLYAVNTAGELYSSDDLAAHFYRRATEIPWEILTVAVDPERPWVVYVGTVFGGVYKSESDAIEWTQTNAGMDVPIVYSLAIDPSNPAILYAGSLDAVYKSTNGGASWQKRSSGLAAGPVTDLQIDPADRQTVFAAVNGQGVFGSRDGGSSWSVVRNGPFFVESTPLAFSQTVPGMVFAGTQGGGVFRSSDHGASWGQSNEGLTVFIKDVAIDPSNPSVMYAASLLDGVFKSIDGAASWTRQGLAGRFLYSLAIDPQSPQTLYASTPTGPTRSRDGGATWVDLSQRMPYVFSLASDPSDRAKVYAAGGGELHRSRDAGRTWTLAASGLPRVNVLALAVDPAAQRIYAGLAPGGVYVSANDGASWRQAGSQGIGSATVASLAVDPRNGHVYAGTFGGGLFKSVDAGDSWTPLAGLPGAYVSSVQVDPLDPDVVFAARLSEDGAGAGVHVSTDAGASWRASALGIDSATVYGIALDRADPRVLVAAAATGVFKSTDRGASWQLAGGGLTGLDVRQLLIDGVRIYAGTAGHGIYTSGNGGTTWGPAQDPFGDLYVTGFALGTGPGIVYAATGGNGVIYSAASPSAFEGGTEAGYAQAVFHQIAIDPRSTSTLYAATGGQGVLKSVDGGITWRSASRGLDDPFLITVVIDPVQPDTLYAGTTGGGVFLSEDGATSWRPLNAGLFHKRIASLTIDANDHRVIYAGTEGGGVFRLRR